MRADALLHLGGQLTRGGEDEHADGVPVALLVVGLGGGALVEALEDRQHERGRLAGARLGAREQVATGKDVGDGFALDRRGLGVALLSDSAE